MKPLLVHEILFIIFLCGSCNAKSQQSNSKPLFIDECRTSFALNNYSLTKKIEISSGQLSSNPFTQKFNSNGLSGATVLIFTSTKEEQNKIKLGFKIVLYEYKSAVAAALKFKEIEKIKETQEESILAKDWDCVLLQDDYILRLDAICIYSKSAWQQLKVGFLGIVSKVIKKTPTGTIECECGGNCK